MNFQCEYPLSSGIPSHFPTSHCWRIRGNEPFQSFYRDCAWMGAMNCMNPCKSGVGFVLFTSWNHVVNIVPTGLACSSSTFFLNIYSNLPKRHFRRIWLFYLFESCYSLDGLRPCPMFDNTMHQEQVTIPRNSEPGKWIWNSGLRIRSSRCREEMSTSTSSSSS